MLPTQAQEHETIEFTEGINDWSELGFYIFTAEQNGHGMQWVGDHIRPRVRIPPRWHWPVGVSLSTEFGYARPAVFESDVVLADHADRGSNHWPLVLVGERERWSGISMWSRRLRVSRRSRSRLTISNVAPQGVTFGPAATLTYAPSKVFQFRRGVLFVLRAVGKFCFSAQSAAAGFPGGQSVRFAQVGDQYSARAGAQLREPIISS